LLQEFRGMPRWPILLLLTACAGGPGLEAEAARAALAAYRGSPDSRGAPRALPAARERHVVHGPGQVSSLLGASPEAVRTALGEPLLRRSEGPAQVWLYSGGGCQVDIVLYPSEAGPRVAHVQARAGGLAQRTEASCLRDIASQGASQGNARTIPGGARPERHPPSSLLPSTETDV